MNLKCCSLSAPFLVCCIGIFAVYLYSSNFMDFSVNDILAPLGLKEEKYLQFTHVKFGDIEAQNLASSVWCMKRLDDSKLCNFKNLYYLPKFKGHLIFILNDYSVISGIESPKSLKKINLSTVQNHSGLYLKLIIVQSFSYLLEEKITNFIDNAVIMSRFKPDNIMHVIHDDLLPLFLTYEELCKGDVQLCLSSYKLVFIDDNYKGPYNKWYNIFSNYEPNILGKQKFATCMRNSVVGLSQESVWFQYGFQNVHGPLMNSQFSGLQLRRFTEFVKQQFRVKKDHVRLPNETRTIIFLNRKVNRKILNDYSLEKRVKQIYQTIYNAPVDILSMDLATNSTEELILSIKKSKFLIGMHGSAMLLAVFLPEGSNIIEMFPFGIQPEFVSPLRALFSLPNMFYNYTAWVNKNESNSRTHPEYDPLHGGLVHLPLSSQKNIQNIKLVPPVECCHNPTYLFRMFQDTVVDESFYDLIHRLIRNENDSLERSYSRVQKITTSALWYFPPPVFNLSCTCAGKFLKVKWSFPFHSTAKVKFSLATSSGVAAVTGSTYFVMEMENCDKDEKERGSNFKISVWVKTLEAHKESIDSYINCI